MGLVGGVWIRDVCVQSGMRVGVHAFADSVRELGQRG